MKSKDAWLLTIVLVLGIVLGASLPVFVPEASLPVFVPGASLPVFDPYTAKRAVLIKNCIRNASIARLVKNGYDPAKQHSLSLEYLLPKGIGLHWKITRVDPAPVKLMRHNREIQISGSGRRTVTFRPYCCGTKVLISVNLIDHKPGGQRWRKFAICEIRYDKRPPTAKITGGDKITVPDGREIFVSGAESKIYTPKDKKAYLWTCQHKPTSTFCNDFSSTAENFTIPAEFVTAETNFRITLRVTLIRETVEYDVLGNEIDKDREDTIVQVIHVLRNAAQLEITCVKNCPSLTEPPNERVSTVLSGSCKTNCESVRKRHFLWSIEYDGEPLEFDYEHQSEFGRFGDKFIIKDSALKPMKYVIKLVLDKKSVKTGETEMKLEFESPPLIRYCFVRPLQGQALVTLFKLNCTLPADQSLKYHYELTDPLGSTLIAGTSPDIFSDEYILSDKIKDRDKLVITVSSFGKSFLARYEIVVQRISVVTEGSDETVEKFTTTTTTTPSPPSTMPPAQIAVLEISINDVSMDDSRDIQKLRVIVKKILKYSKDGQKNPTMEKLISKLKKKLKDDLLDPSLDIPDELLEIGNLFSDLFFGTTKDNATLGGVTSVVCKQLANEILSFMKDDEWVLNKGEEVNKTVESMLKCIRASTYPHPFDIGPPRLPGVAPLPSETWLVPPEYGGAVNEDYPDYDYHNQTYDDQLDALIVSTNNLLNVTSVVAKTMTLTNVIGEKAKEFQSGPINLLVFKETGQNLAGMGINSLGNSITPSRDLKDNPEHTYDLLVSSFEGDMMWWNPDKIKTATNILNVEFWHSACKERVGEFDKPTKLTLSITNTTSDGDFFHGEFKIPENFSWTAKEVDSLAFIYRITFAKDMEVRVTFQDLPEVETVFEAVLTTLRLATPEDFKNSIKIGKNTNFISTVNTEDYNVWLYLSFLPKMDAFQAGTTLPYSMRVVGAACMRWNVANHTWEIGCQPEASSNRSVILCQCRKFSAIAGYLGKIPVIPQTIRRFKGTMQIQVCYVIFLSTFCAFLVYCLLIICAGFKRKRPFYYLADNVESHNYYYLVIVKTSDWPNSGTTSSISIKIRGELEDSLPHLLNYPDPEKRMLQRCGEDLFVLATGSYLGPIARIEVWTDNYGFKPTWSCSQILIFDFQKFQEWYFPIDTVMSSEYNTQFISKRPNEQTKKKCRGFKLVNQHHTWCIWEDRGERFSYMKKLTVLLSTTLVLFSATLFAYGNPRLGLSDVVEDFPVFTVNLFTLTIGLITGLVSFALRTILSQAFLESKIQYSKYGIQPVKLPFPLTIICWSLLIILVVVSASHLIVFGFWVPCFTSLRWLTSVVIGLATDILIFEPVLVLIKNCFPFKRLKSGIGGQYSPMLDEIKRQRDWFHRKFGIIRFRDYFDHIYVPLTKPEANGLKKEISLRRTIIRDLQDLVMFVGYLIILLAIVMVTRQTLAVFSNRNMVDMVNGTHLRSQSLGRMPSMNGTYGYIKDTLIPTTQPSFWYGNYVIFDAALMIDAQTKIVGVARLRQHRMPVNGCTIPKIMRPFNLSCTWLPPNRTNSSHGWGLPNETLNDSLPLDNQNNIWEFHPDPNTTTFIGKCSVYSGDSYVAFLGRKFYNSMVNLHNLLKTLWIDPGSGIVFVEFLTYNVNYNLFTAVRIVFEQCETGLISTAVYTNVSRMLSENRDMSKILFALAIVFGIWIGIIIIRKSKGMAGDCRTMIKDPWLIIDFFIILLSISCVILYALRTLTVGNYLSEVEKSRNNEFVNYFSFTYLDDVLITLGAILVCVATIRLLKFLRCCLIFRTMQRTLYVAAAPLLTLTIWFIILMFFFGGCGYMLYGSEADEFNTVPAIAATLMILTIQPARFDPITALGHYSSYLYFTLYVIIVLFFLIFFIVILISAYGKAQLELSGEYNQYDFYDYLVEVKQRVWTYLKCPMKRSKGKIDHKKYSAFYPKPFKFRYAKSVVTTGKKLNKMRLAGIANLRKQRGKSADPKLMSNIAAHFAIRREDKTRKKIFHKGKEKGFKFKVVPERRMREIAGIADKIAVLPDDDDRGKIWKRKPVLEENQETLNKIHLDIIKVRNDVDDILKRLGFDDIGRDDDDDDMWGGLDKRDKRLDKKVGDDDDDFLDKLAKM